MFVLKIYKNLLIFLVSVNIFTRIFFHEISNFLIVISIILFGIIVLIRVIFKPFFYKYSIKYVDKRYVLANNILSNSYCTVSYIPDTRITVVEKIKSSTPGKKMFTLEAKTTNIDKTWSQICRFFDNDTYFGHLVSFCSMKTKLNVVTIGGETTPAKKNQEPKQEIKELETKPVEISSDKPQKPKVPKFNTQGKETYDMAELLQPKSTGTRLNINIATPEEIANLHGINIVIAKKIVQHRDLNGPYKNFEEFMKIARLKDAFADKIKDSISFDIPKISELNNSNKNDGRIVDF